MCLGMACTITSVAHFKVSLGWIKSTGAPSFVVDLAPAALESPGEGLHGLDQAPGGHRHELGVVQVGASRSVKDQSFVSCCCCCSNADPDFSPEYPEELAPESCSALLLPVPPGQAGLQQPAALLLLLLLEAAVAPERFGQQV